MSELSVSREVAVSPETLWELITDLDRSPNVISAVTAIERLDDGTGFGVGTRWQETRMIFGKEATEILEVTEIDPGRSYTVEADNLGANYRSVISVEPGPAGSVITITFGAEATSTVSKVVAGTIGKLFEGGTRKAMAKDLDDIAVVAEADD
ncbi:MAG: SRPBCC family protein [Acidimicrobiia bacterium]